MKDNFPKQSSHTLNTSIVVNTYLRLIICRLCIDVAKNRKIVKTEDIVNRYNGVVYVDTTICNIQ